MEKDELMFNRDYHLAWMLGLDFEKRMWDIYTGLGTSERPAYLDDIFFDTSQMQALIFLEHSKEDPGRLYLSDREWKQLYEGVWNNEDYATMEVLDRVSYEEKDNVIHDIFYYLNKYRISHLVKQNGSNDSFKARLQFAPVKEVW